MASRRLPGKPLADIGGEAMVVRVLRRAVAAGLGPVVVATPDREIADAVAAAGGRAVMTREDHRSGSDRVAEAVARFDGAARCEVVVNLQGDLPTVEASVLRAVVGVLDDPAVDIATAAAEIRDPAEHDDPSVVKAVLAAPHRDGVARALYFSRAAVPLGDGPRHHHIGIYAFRRRALFRFVALPAGTLERREALEQLRALEAGMRIDAALVDTVPLGVDTPADLARVRALISATGQQETGSDP